MPKRLSMRSHFLKTLSVIHTHQESLWTLGLLYLVVITVCAIPESLAYSRCRDIQTDYNFNKTEKSIFAIVQNAPGYQAVLWLSSSGLGRECPDF
jgi:hypothetical protein